MNATKKLKYILPIVILFALLSLFATKLFSNETTNDKNSSVLNDPLPNFQIPNLLNPQQEFTQKDLQKGRVVLLNVWASWCSACQDEHPMLMEIKQYVPIYGIDYKDDAKTAIKWLQENGNPYAMIGNDANGDTAIDFGIYGTPETFVINKQGQIVYRYLGIIDKNAWENILYPIVKQYQNAP